MGCFFDYVCCCCYACSIFLIILLRLSQEEQDLSQVVFISETPVGVHERTSMKEHLVKHKNIKIQVHTTKRNKQQQKQNRTHFQNKK